MKTALLSPSLPLRVVSPLAPVSAHYTIYSWVSEDETRYNSVQHQPNLCFEFENDYCPGISYE